MATALSVIEKALRVLRVLDRNQPLQPDDRNDAMQALNSVTAWIATEYNHLWLEELYILLCKQGIPSYTMGAGGTYITEQSNLLVLSLTANALAGATTVTVSNASGISTGFQIAVFDNNGNSFFTTANGAPVGNVVALTNALSVASDSGNVVYAYSAVAPRALRVRNAQYADSITASEIPVERMSRDIYFDQPIKTTQGASTNWYYDPQIPVGKMYLWPTPYADKNVFRFTGQRPFTINENNIDTVDFPDEWIMCLSYQLAVFLMDEYGLPADRQAIIKSKADELLASCLAFDNDGDGVAIEIDRWS